MTGTVLTEQIILDKTKVSNLSEVRQLDLWGVGLSDVSVVSKLTSVQMLALTANGISTLKCFAPCATLEELYLRKNNVSALREVTYLKSLKKLHTLWLVDNPCAKHPLYREFVLHCCASLKQLDKVEVTAEERVAAAKRMTVKHLDEILGKGTSGKAAAATPSSPTPGATTTKECANASMSGHISGNSASIIEERNASGRSVPFTTVQAQRAMLTAIVSLLPELTVESLDMLEREVHTRVEKQRQQAARQS